MKLINFLPDTALTRESDMFTYLKSGVILDSDDLGQGTVDVELYVEDDGIHIAKEGTVSGDRGDFLSNRIKVDRQFVQTMTPSCDAGLFTFDPVSDEAHKSDMVWCLAESVGIPNGQNVTMAYFPLDNGVLVCLKEGYLEIQTNSDGDSVPLVRGDVKFEYDDDDKPIFPSVGWVSSESFEGGPAFAGAADCFLTFTINRSLKTHTGRKKTVELKHPTNDFKLRIHQEASAYLDGGASYRASIEAEEAKKAEEARLSEEQARVKASVAAKRASEGTAKKASTRRTSTVSSKPVDEGYSDGAAAFLKAALKK